MRGSSRCFLYGRFLVLVIIFGEYVYYEGLPCRIPLGDSSETPSSLGDPRRISGGFLIKSSFKLGDQNVVRPKLDHQT